MKPVQFPDKYTITFHKAVWSEQELSLARCYDFEIISSPQSIVVKCNIKKTSHNAAINFLALSFRALIESPLREAERRSITDTIDHIYATMMTAREAIAKEKIKYWDRLRSYQRESVLLMMGRRCNLLSFEQGLGKTITSATVSKLLNIKRTLIICIPVAKWNWQDDLCNKFEYNPLYWSILDSKRSKTIKALSPAHERFIAIHYQAIPKHLDYLLAMQIDHIIIDECQFMKNHNTQIYKNVDKIVEAFPNTRISFLSGTPIKNRVDDLFAYFKMARHELGKNRAKFIREFAQTGKGRNLDKVVGAKNIDQLTMCMANFMIRRTKKECPELPARNYIKVVVDIGDYQAEYDKIIADMLANKEKSAVSGHIISLNRIFAMAKTKAAIELMEDLNDKEEKVVAFTSFKDPINMLESHFKESCVKVDGDVDHSERFVRVKKFANDPKVMNFLGNIIAAGTSLNLVVASHGLFLNFPFTASEIAQCVDRLHRIGQENAVFIYFFVCKDTIDEVIYDLVAKKQGEINQIIDGGEGFDFNSDVKEKLFQSVMQGQYVS